MYSDGLSPDPEKPCRCRDCAWTGPIWQTLAEDTEGIKCPRCSGPVDILVEE